jgi:hypothetical protein
MSNSPDTWSTRVERVAVEYESVLGVQFDPHEFQTQSNAYSIAWHKVDRIL